MNLKERIGTFFAKKPPSENPKEQKPHIPFIDLPEMNVRGEILHVGDSVFVEWEKPDLEIGSSPFDGVKNVTRQHAAYGTVRTLRALGGIGGAPGLCVEREGTREEIPLFRGQITSIKKYKLQN